MLLISFEFRGVARLLLGGLDDLDGAEEGLEPALLGLPLGRLDLLNRFQNALPVELLLLHEELKQALLVRLIKGAKPPKQS